MVTKQKRGTKIPMKTNPVLLDKVLQEIQQALMSHLPWLTKAYGRSYPRKETKNNRIVTYPVYYKGGGEYESLLPNDRLSGLSYFEIYDPQEISSVNLRLPKIKASGALVIWYDLNKIFTDKATLYTEEIKRDVLRVLMTPGILSSGRFTITKVYERFDNIYREYKLSDMDSRLLSFPYAGLRIEFELITKEECL